MRRSGMLTNALQRNVKRSISEPVGLHLNKPRMDMWDQLLKAFKETLEKAENTYLIKAKSEYDVIDSCYDLMSTRLQLH